MKLFSLVEVLTAAHLTAYVTSEAFPERGGIMLLAPPGQLKTTIINNSLMPYVPQAMISSDINVDTLNRTHDQMSNGQIITLALPAFEKIYERNPQTASNVEGHIKGMCDEGFLLPSYKDQRMLGQTKARVLVVGGLVKSCYERHFTRWQENGLTRRFMWSSFHLANPEILTNAVHKWERIKFQNRIPTVPSDKIPMNVTRAESEELRKMILQQGSDVTPYMLLKKILACLKWKFDGRSEKKIPMEIMRDFGVSLGQASAKLEL